MATADPEGLLREEAAGLSAWVELIRHRFTALAITPYDPHGVDGAISSRRIGPLQASSVRSSPQRFDRTGRSAAADTEGLLAVGLVEHGTGRLEQDGRSCLLSAGDFALYDTTRPFTWAFGDDWTLRVYTWPHAWLHRSDTATVEVTARAVPRVSAMGGLLTPMLRRLTDEGAPDLAPASAARFATEVAEMAVIAASGTGGGDLGGADRDLLHRAQHHIEDHLDDPDLDPARVAAALFVSVRTLHRLFARQELTVSAWIKSRRLEACRRALCTPGAADTTIKEIAARHGFPHAPLFSREFAQRYGETPRECRRRHDGHGLSP